MLSIRLPNAGLLLAFDDADIRSDFTRVTESWLNARRSAPEAEAGHTEKNIDSDENEFEIEGMDSVAMIEYLLHCLNVVEVAKGLLGGPETVSGTPEELGIADLLAERAGENVDGSELKPEDGEAMHVDVE